MKLGSANKKQLTFEAETLAALIAAKLWTHVTKGKHCILFVDNEGTKFSLLKGFNDNAVVDKLAELFVCHEADMRSYTWISRVPSASNLADAPSRGNCALLLASGFGDVSVDASSILCDVLRCLE